VEVVVDKEVLQVLEAAVLVVHFHLVVMVVEVEVE